MRVLLFQPNYDTHVVHPSLGLGYIASFLETKGYDVDIFDGTREKAQEEDFLKKIEDFKADVVGITVLARGHTRVKKLIKSIKAEFPKVRVLVGGTQVTAAPQLVYNDLGADFAIVGEGEVTFSELLERLADGKNEKLNDVAGIVYKESNGNIQITQPRDFVADLDSLPFPAWHLMPPSEYRIAPILAPAKGSPVAPIITSRGCPYDCTFCASNVTWKRKLRMRSPGNVLNEIKLLVEKYGVKEIHISDDTFTTDIKRAVAICDAIYNEGIDIPWQCPNGIRVDSLTPELLGKMRRSGCYSIGMGIESGNQEILDRTDKKLNLNRLKSALEDIKKAGIKSYGFFILGLPGDTSKTVEDTINFALEVPLDRAWFNIFAPYPGSRAFNEWLKEKHLDFADIDWEKHDCNTAVMVDGDLTAEKLEEYQKTAARQFYFRPRILLSILSELNPRSIVTLLMTRFLKKQTGFVMRLLGRENHR